MPQEPDAAKGLERALLPTNLPEVPGWSIATLYQPAGDTVLVGGDFYDWFARPDGTFALLVGDVAGKGQVAATVGMAIRKGMKALLWAVPEIDEAVAVLERALADEVRETMASFCYVELASTEMVRVLSAGHPPPWIVRNGAASPIELPHNTLFGLREQGRWESSCVEILPGDLLLLFSDGLTEARLADGGLLGEGELQAFVTAQPKGLRCWELAMALSNLLEEPSIELRDDLVVAVLQRAVD